MAPVDSKALALCITFPILAIISVVARFYARHVKNMSRGLDDWVIIVALVSTNLSDKSAITLQPATIAN